MPTIQDNYVSYNGARFVISSVDSIDSTAVFDEAGNNIIYFRNTVTVNGIIPSSNKNYPGTSDPAKAFNQNYVLFQEALRAERQPFIMVLGGITLYDVTPYSNSNPDLNNGYNVDVANGPLPQSIKITDIIGTCFARIQFTVAFFTTNCINSEGSPPQQVLSHKYSVTHEYDSASYCTRTIRGKIIVRASDPTAPNPINPDAFRSQVTPKVPTSMVRESMSFVVTPDGLTLDYEIKDKEVYLVPPSLDDKTHATKCDAQHSLNLQFDPKLGPTWIHACNITIEGSKNIQKIDLYNMAYAILDSIIGFTVDENQELVTNYNLAEDLFENRIQMQIAKRLFYGSNSFVPSVNLHFFEAVKGTDSNMSSDLGPYGTAAIAAAKMLFYPVCDNSLVVAAEQSQNGASTGPLVTVSQSQPSAIPDSGNSNINPDQIANPYTSWSETIEWVEHNNMIILPSTTSKAASLVYQTGTPYITQSQIGRCCRRGMIPVAPKIWNSGSSGVKGVRVNRKIKTETPTTTEDAKSIQYCINWVYEYILPQGTNFDLTDNGLIQLGWKTGNKNNDMPVPIPRSRVLKDYNSADDAFNVNNTYFLSSDPIDEFAGDGGILLGQNIFPS